MEHDITLNIHYTAPEAVWQKIDRVYASMPYWNAQEKCWNGDEIELYTSVEPGGIQIAGTMPDIIWTEWIDTLKRRLTEALGYEIGAPEEGFPFKYWTPFEKQYANIQSIDSEKIVFSDYSEFDWNLFDAAERNPAAKTPYFVLRSPYIELRILFDETGIASKRKIKQQMQAFHAKLEEHGLRITDQ